MSITDKTRKILWGRSGSRCAYCRHRLVLDASDRDTEAIVGDECHIASGAGGGPRYDPQIPSEQIDQLDNLILLCRVHHKMVDDQAGVFTVERLKTLRRTHERWVEDRLSKEEQPKPVRIVRSRQAIPEYLVRAMSAKTLVDAAFGSSGMYSDYPADLTDEQLGTVRDFFQNLTDWSDLGLDDATMRIDAQRSLAGDLSSLERMNLRVYLARERQRMEGGTAPPSPVDVLHVRIVRADDPDQIEVPPVNPSAK